MIETNYFRITPGKYVRTAMAIWMGRWWWTIALPLVALIILGVWDIRFIIVALAAIFVIYPGIMMIIYFNYALRQEAALSVIEHKAIISPDSITIIFKKQEDRSTPHPRTYTIKEISKTEDTGNSLMLTLATSRYDFIELPADAFQAGDYNAAILQLIDKNQQQT